MYGYKVVEKALGQLHAIDEPSLGAFRGRIKHFQRIGLVTSSPGKGRRIEYSFSDAALWAFGLEMEEFGIDPIVVKTIVDRCWKDVLPAIESYGVKNDQFFVTNPSMVSSRSWINAFIGRVITGDNFSPKLEGVKRVLIVNLTQIGRDLSQALDRCSAPDEILIPAPIPG